MPEPDARIGRRSGGRVRKTGWVLGWGVSIALHASVIGAGSFLVWSIQQESDEATSTDATVVVFQNAGLTPKPVERASTQPESSATQNEIDALFEPAPLSTQPAVMLPPPEVDLFREPAAEPPPNDDQAPPAIDASDIVRDAEFFGTGASDAKRIVYVVDASGSSIAIFPAVARELERSLLSLNATQHATVIAASGRPASHGKPAESLAQRAPGDGLVRTTTRGARRLADWFAGDITPSGRSDLLLALREAFTLRPDAIFLLASPDNASTKSDSFLDELDRLNPVDPKTGRRLAVIGVVSVGPPAVGDPLTEIARVHGAESRVVVLNTSKLLEGAR